MVSNAIKVYARLKPEKKRKNLVNYKVHHRPEEDFLLLVAPTQRTKDYPDNRPETWNFSFFRIFEESATQQDVFENVAQPVLESALDGYNGTIFAYGQTASGKTYTITGKRESQECLGIIPRTLLYLFDAIQKALLVALHVSLCTPRQANRNGTAPFECLQHPENVYSIEVAYLEIYNENGYDLLDRRQQREFPVTRLEDLPRVTVQEDEIGRLHPKNLTFHCVGSAEDAFELLLVGDGNRITAETPMNPESSRSHCIFTIVVCTKQFGVDEYKRAKVHLVDLAGSERVYKCSISGTILTEAKHINLSLHYLEQVIVCLGQESAGHIPYRNSLLTSILRDSLGGNCLTTMLATLSISADNLEETISTCRFAQRVALIRNDVRLVLEKDVQSENALLRLENEKLRQQLKELTRDTRVEELTSEDKRNLDIQIGSFLESDENLRVDNNPKKIEYCFESFKRILKLNRDPNSCLKKLEYYKDLVIQRDKEISLLIDLMKKGRKKSEEGSCNETRLIREKLEDAIKLPESPSTLISKFDQIDVNVESSEPAEALPKIPIEGNDKVSSALSNFLNGNIPSRKQQTKSKVIKSVSQRNLNNINRIKSDVAQDICTNIDTVDRKESLNKLIPNDSSRQSLLSCNVVNLTLNDSEKIDDETTPKLVRKRNRSKKKVVETESSIESSSAESKIKEMEVPSIEINDSTSFYRRFLSFNVPKNLKSLDLEHFTAERSINHTDHASDPMRINSSERWSMPRPNFREDDLESNLKSPVVREGDESSDRSRECRKTDRLTCSKSSDANLREAYDSLNSRRNAGSLENEAKERHPLTRSNARSFNDKIDSCRSKTSEKGTRVSSFAPLFPEKPPVFGGQVKFEEKEVVRASKRDEDKYLENTLPLTGDPEIDEEIIAFYKAKRSGGTY